MKNENTKLYASSKAYLDGSESMDNELLLWYVAGGIFLKEVVKRQKGNNLGSLYEDIGIELHKQFKKISILDICCGPGTFANYISLIYPNVKITGIDKNKIF